MMLVIQQEELYSYMAAGKLWIEETGRQNKQENVEISYLSSCNNQLAMSCASQYIERFVNENKTSGFSGPMT